MEIRKYDFVDILRAIAVIGVVAVHSHQGIAGLNVYITSIFNYGQLGVQLFFVASAVTLCLSMEQRLGDGVFNFYIRRFFRIAPLYYFGIIFYFLWRCVIHYKAGNTGVPQDYNLVAVFGNLVFVHGFHPSNFNFIVPGGWSISVEMMFYLVFPFLFHALRVAGARNFALISIAVAGGAFIAQVLLIEFIQPRLVSVGFLQGIQKNDEFGFLYASFINQISIFLIGMLGYGLFARNLLLKSSIFLWVGLLLIVAACVLQNNRSHDTGFDGFFYPVVSAVAFVIFMLKLSSVSLGQGRFVRAMIAIGKNSFSIYLIHFFVLDLARFAWRNLALTLPQDGFLELSFVFFSTLSVTYVISMFTMRYIETPGIRLGSRIIKSINAG